MCDRCSMVSAGSQWGSSSRFIWTWLRTYRFHTRRGISYKLPGIYQVLMKAWTNGLAHRTRSRLVFRFLVCISADILTDTTSIRPRPPPCTYITLRHSSIILTTQQNSLSHRRRAKMKPWKRHCNDFTMKAYWEWHTLKNTYRYNDTFAPPQNLTALQSACSSYYDRLQRWY